MDADSAFKRFLPVIWVAIAVVVVACIWHFVSKFRFLLN